MATNDPIDELIAFLSATRTELRTTIAAVPRVDRARRPAAGAWSIAQIVEHLALVERQITGLLSTAVAKAQEAGLRPTLTASIVGSIDLAQLRDRTRRIEARETNQPGRGLDAETALQELEAARMALLAVIEESRRADLSVSGYPHPVFGYLNGYQWLAFVGGHEARHTDQIRDVAKTLSPSV